MRWWLVFGLVLAAGAAMAQTPAVRQPNTVQAQGSAVATAKPDQVRVDIGVVSQAGTAQQAASDNARQFGSVLAEIKNALGDKGEVQTISYGISPNYKYARDGGSPTVTGYTATNVVRVTINDVERAGKIVDAASKIGANSVRGIEFGMRDEQALRASALAQATRNARVSAEAMATALGKKVVQVLRVEDTPHGEIRPMQERMVMAAQASDAVASTAFMPGNIRIEVSVTLVAEIGN
jgi:hypothetical protein